MSKEKEKKDYRDYICIAISISFFACTLLLFPYAFARIAEAFRDLGTSFVFYVVGLFSKITGNEYTTTSTVTELPKLPFSSVFEKVAVGEYPDIFLSLSWEEFKGDWTRYWSVFFTIDNILGYFSLIGKIFSFILTFFLVILPLFLIFAFWLGRAFKKVEVDHKKVSRFLKVWLHIENIAYVPVKNWCREFIAFVRSNKVYLKIWLYTWLFNFNIFTIVIEFIAYALYFVSSFDMISLYGQVYKLLFDLAPMFNFIPVLGWAIAVFFVLNFWAKRIAFNTLRHREQCNRGFLNERGVVTVVYGPMGAGKTMTVTDLLLSAEVQLRDQALEVILECDMKFPNFPWRQLEDDLKWAIRCHVVYDVWSCRRWIRKKYKRFMKNPCPEKLYGYDYVKYGSTYNDNLTVTGMWKVFEDYSCAYLIYTVQSSLLITNFSVRTDNLYMDLGNFPLWNCDFFDRDSRLLDSFSRHSHILDQDMLRLGKQMLKNNPNRNALGFGVYGVTEIDKERKNSPELNGVDKNAEECNQKNDLFNTMLKMIRHACVVCNRVFVRIIADLQRPESLGADARELGEVAYIDGQSGSRPVLPFFSPFWLFELVYLWLWRKFKPFYLNAEFMRGDSLLRLYLVKNVMAKLRHLHMKICNLYGSETITIEVESGRMEGKAKVRKLYRQKKKVLAGRYSTDCLSGIFEERAAMNMIGIDDLREYADIMATNDELLAQHSHFQTEIVKVRLNQATA